MESLKHQWKNLDQVHDTAELIKSFVPHFTALNRKKRAQIAAAKSWSKENRDKRKENQEKKFKETPLTGIAGLLFASSISKRAPSKK
jgi:hypothetical protein